jgi:ABC-type oligopeptide transport system ATPase subunit
MGSGALVSALNGASFSIASGTTLALVGDSGSGKSTLALCLACLQRPTSGRIWFEGRNLAALGEKELRTVRPQIQLIFQDPARSINGDNMRCAIGPSSLWNVWASIERWPPGELTNSAVGRDKGWRSLGP